MKGTPSRAGWPAWFKHFRSDDLDEVRAYVDRDVGPHFRIAHQPGPVGFDMHVAAGQTLTVGWNSVAVGKTIRGRTEHPVLHLESPPGTVFRLGRQVLKATVAGAATLTGAGCEFTRSSPAGQLFAIQLDGATLECEISARQGLVPGAWTWALARLRLDETQRQSLQADAWQFTQALAPDAPPTHAAFCASRIVASVAKAVVAQDAARPAGALSQQRLRSLEAWIDAHLDSPISLGKLCAQAGVGERCLQKAFETHRGMSPLRFVTERRLHASRRRLAEAGPAQSVTRVALDLGFDHLGRFAAQYRELFGELPSQTQRQRQDRSFCG